MFNSGDTAWLLTSSALVLLMTVPGLALFYGGLVRKKNVLSTMYYSLAAALVISILWVVAQYSLAFAPDANGIFGNLSKVFFNGVTVSSAHPLAPTVPETVFSMFQLMFAIITVALISGAVVERMSFTAWMIFIVVWSFIVYTPLAHMVWGGGFIGAKLGALDFAGGLVVHISSGVSALVAALVLGERVRYKKDAILPGNIPMVLIGTGLLWFGWFGFNAGSACAANGLAGSAFLVTHIAAATAGFVWLLIEWILHKKPTIVGACSGVVAGLVAITPAAGFVNVQAALLIGALVSVICYVFVAIIKKVFGYDDSLDAFGIHGIGGMWGALATGLFASPAINSYTGFVYGNPAQLQAQAVSIGIAIAIAIVGTLISLGVARLFTPLRVDPQDEINGCDLATHGERAE